MAIFQIPLSAAEYGRAMTADPNLYVYDPSSSWNGVGWLGASTTDARLMAGLVLPVGLTLLYAWFRTSKSWVQGRGAVEAKGEGRPLGRRESTPEGRSTLSGNEGRADGP